MNAPNVERTYEMNDTPLEIITEDECRIIYDRICVMEDLSKSSHHYVSKDLNSLITQKGKRGYTFTPPGMVCEAVTNLPKQQADTHEALVFLHPIETSDGCDHYGLTKGKSLIRPVVSPNGMLQYEANY